MKVTKPTYPVFVRVAVLINFDQCYTILEIKERPIEFNSRAIRLV